MNIEEPKWDYFPACLQQIHFGWFCDRHRKRDFWLRFLSKSKDWGPRRFLRVQTTYLFIRSMSFLLVVNCCNCCYAFIYFHFRAECSKSYSDIHPPQIEDQQFWRSRSRLSYLSEDEPCKSTQADSWQFVVHRPPWIHPPLPSVDSRSHRDATENSSKYLSVWAFWLTVRFSSKHLWSSFTLWSGACCILTFDFRILDKSDIMLLKGCTDGGQNLPFKDSYLSSFSEINNNSLRLNSGVI